jgi:hypothetical protein
MKLVIACIALALLSWMADSSVTPTSNQAVDCAKQAIQVRIIAVLKIVLIDISRCCGVKLLFKMRRSGLKNSPKIINIS